MDRGDGRRGYRAAWADLKVRLYGDLYGCTLRLDGSVDGGARLLHRTLRIVHGLRGLLGLTGHATRVLAGRVRRG